eukprot:SAG22_NODE_14846_length_363_cov_0.984848_2_plen_79_part_01
MRLLCQSNSLSSFRARKQSIHFKQHFCHIQSYVKSKSSVRRPRGRQLRRPRGRRRLGSAGTLPIRRLTSTRRRPIGSNS